MKYKKLLESIFYIPQQGDIVKVGGIIGVVYNHNIIDNTVDIMELNDVFNKNPKSVYIYKGISCGKIKPMELEIKGIRVKNLFDLYDMVNYEVEENEIEDLNFNDSGEDISGRLYRRNYNEELQNFVKLILRLRKRKYGDKLVVRETISGEEYVLDLANSTEKTVDVLEDLSQEVKKLVLKVKINK